MKPREFRQGTEQPGAVLVVETLHHLGQLVAPLGRVKLQPDRIDQEFLDVLHATLPGSGTARLACKGDPDVFVPGDILAGQPVMRRQVIHLGSVISSWVTFFNSFRRAFSFSVRATAIFGLSSR